MSDAFVPSFSGLNQAPVFERGTPLPIGDFDVKITRVLAKRTFNKGDALIVELEAVNTYGNPDIQPGEKRSWFQKLIDPSVALPAIKGFMIAALGYDYKRQKAEVDANISPQLEALLQDALANGSLEGTMVHVTTFQKATKPKPGIGKDGQPTLVSGTFTVHEWSPCKVPVPA